MSYGQRYKDGEAPKEIFIVTNGHSYKIYSNLSTARGLKTRNNNEWRTRHTGSWKIYKVVVDEAQEIE